MVRAAIFTRWGRFLLGALFVLAAIFVGVSAFGNTDVKTKSAVLADGKDVTNSSGYQYSELTFQGDSATYRLDHREFKPTLTTDTLAASLDDTVQIWYTTPLTAPARVVAIEIKGVDGQTTKYVTSTYTDPAGERTSNFIAAGFLAVVALGFIIAGAFLPTQFGRRRQPVTVGAQQQPPYGPGMGR